MNPWTIRRGVRDTDSVGAGRNDEVVRGSSAPGSDAPSNAVAGDEQELEKSGALVDLTDRMLLGLSRLRASPKLKNADAENMSEGDDVEAVAGRVEERRNADAVDAGVQAEAAKNDVVAADAVARDNRESAATAGKPTASKVAPTGSDETAQAVAVNPQRQGMKKSTAGDDVITLVDMTQKQARRRRQHNAKARRRRRRKAR